MRITLVDDHHLERETLASVLGSSAVGIEVVGQASGGAQALKVVDETAPDVVLLDLKLSDEVDAAEDEGLGVADTLRSTHPEIGLLVRSAYAQPAYAQRLLDLAGPRGAVGYLRKGSGGGLHELIWAIGEVARGEIVIDPVIIRTLMSRARPSDDPLALLSPKERNVLERIARGESNLTIAQKLGSKISTIERDASTIFAKLGITTGSADERRRKNARVLAALTFLRHVAPARKR